MAIDYFSAALALDQNGRIVRDAEADIYALADTTFSNPLAITDLQGVPMAKLRSNSDGIYPDFRVVADVEQIVAKSGDRITPMTSLGVIAADAEAARDEAVAAASTAGSNAATAQSAVSQAASARDQAVAAKDAAEAVGTTNDSVIASRVNDPSSQTRSAIQTLVIENGGGGQVVQVIEDPENPGFALLVVGTPTPEPAVPPTISTTALNPLTQGVAFSQQLAITGEAPINVFVSAGTLPAGLSISASGVISGTPTGSGAYAFTVTATNAAGVDEQAYTGTVTASGTAPTITTTTLGSISQGVPFSRQLQASGSAPVTFAVTTGLLPAGLTLSSSGLLSGTPTGSGAYSFTITATNGNGSDPQAYSGTITASTGAPSRVASYGPNGTHYPSRTPWVGDTGGWDYDVEVACTWTAIGTAINTAATQYPNGKCRIRVQPGTLPGNGAGSTATPVLQNLGAANRATRILVVPRDGAFSITHTASARIHNVVGVSFVGFCPWGAGVAEGSSSGVLITNCRDMAWAWSKTRFANITSSAGTTDGVELVECVAPAQADRDEDRMAFRNGDGGNTRNVILDGCYFAGNYKANGSSAHCDTLQTSGPGVFENIDFRDTALFGSTNATYITTPATSGDIIHSAFVGGMRTANRYPVGADRSQFINGPVTFNGAPTDYTASADSLLVGKVVPVFASVASTKIIAADAAPAPASGSWTVDTGLFDTAAKINAVIPLPTDTSLQAAWAAA